jgi:hypothetical protein
MRNLIIIVLLAGAAFAAYQYGLPAWNTMADLRAQLQQIDDTTAQVKGIEAKRDEVVGRYNDATKNQSQIDRLNAFLPGKLYPEELYIFFETFVAKSMSGAHFDGISISAPSGDASQGGQLVVGFELKASGNYAAVRALLDEVENNLRLMDIGAVGISQNKEGEFSISLKGKLYYGS